MNLSPSKASTQNPRMHLWSRLSLIAVNLLPLAGVLFFEWDLLSVLLFYWLEGLVQCAFAALRALLHSGFRAVGAVLLFVPVAVVLGAAHLAALVVLAGVVDQAGPFAPDLSELANVGLFAALGAIYQGVIAWILLERPSLLLLALPAEALSQAIELWRGPRRAADQTLGSAQAILRQALRILILLQLALLFGGAVIALFEAADLFPVLALLVSFKLLVDDRAYRRATHAAADQTRLPESPGSADS